MSSSAVKAGEAYVEVSLRDKIKEGARRIQSQLSAVSSGLKSYGAGLAAAGGAATAAFGTVAGAIGSAAMSFAETGSELADMSARTGIAADSLSALGYAAKLNGSNLGELEGSIRKMQKAIGDAAGGSKVAAEKLESLGLSADKLLKLSPDQQFAAIAAEIAKIDDPTLRASAAMEIFGKSATRILPLIQSDIVGTIAEAKRLGLVMSVDDANAADALGDAIDTLKTSFAAIYNSIGAAVAGPLTAFAKVATDITGAIGRWIGNNRALFVAIAGISLVGAAAGAAVLTLGGVLMGLGAAIAGVAAAAPFLVGVWGALVTAIAPALPVIAAVAAGLIGVTAAWASVLYIANEAGILSQVFGGISTAANQLWQTMIKTFGGIATALGDGQYSKAAQVLWVGIKLAFFQGAKSSLDAFSWLFNNGLKLTVDFAKALGQTIWNIFKSIPDMLIAALSGGVTLAEILSKALTEGISGSLDASMAAAQEELNRLTAKDPTAAKDQPGKGAASSGAATTGTSEEGQKAFDDRIKALQDETTEMELGADAFDLYKLKLQGVGDEQLAQVQALQAHRNALKAKAKAEDDAKKAAEDATKKAEDDRKSMMDRGKQLTDEVRTPFQVLQDKLKELDTLYAAGAINQQTYLGQKQNATDAFNAPMQNAMKAGRNSIADINTQASLDVVLRTRNSYVGSAGKNNMEGIAKEQRDLLKTIADNSASDSATTIKIQVRKI